LSIKLQALARSAEAKAVQPERLAKDVEVMRRQVKRLSDLVNDLLDVSRISTGRLQLHLDEVDLALVAREVVSQFEPQAVKVGCLLELRTQERVVGRWDRLRVEQVVVNLLSNALKYGAGRPVQVRVEAEGGWARLQVRDEGIGIAPEHLGRIFGKFERAVSERHYGGLGLGLYITRQVVEWMGGSVRVESHPGQGATFRVELPLEGPSPTPPPPPRER
jgi:signal transduction histidine kinase